MCRCVISSTFVQKDQLQCFIHVVYKVVGTGWLFLAPHMWGYACGTIYSIMRCTPHNEMHNTSILPCHFMLYTDEAMNFTDMIKEVDRLKKFLLFGLIAVCNGI